MKALSYYINATLGMHTPQRGSAPQGGVAAACKVGLRPSKIEGMGELKWACPLCSVTGKSMVRGRLKIIFLWRFKEFFKIAS